MDEHNVAASAVTHAALAPAVEDNAPAAAVTYAEQAPDVERIAVTNARSIENLDELPAVPELVETTEAYFTEETNGDMPMQNQIKNGEGDWKKEALPAPKEPEEKYEWAGGVKKRKRLKGKRTRRRPGHIRNYCLSDKCFSKTHGRRDSDAGESARNKKGFP